ncbi:hypothetical protein CGSHiHH_04965, partial [Haemophilus influenzae PittHH]
VSPEILQLETEVAYLKEVRRFRFQDEANHGNYPKVKNMLSVKMAFRLCTVSA